MPALPQKAAHEVGWKLEIGEIFGFRPIELWEQGAAGSNPAAPTN